MPLPVLAQFEEPVDDIAQQANRQMALARGLGLDDHHDGALALGVEGPGGVGDAFALGLPDRTGGTGPQGGSCDGAEVELVGQQTSHVVGEDGAGEDALVAPVVHCHGWSDHWTAAVPKARFYVQ